MDADLVVLGAAEKSRLGERIFFDITDAMLSHADSDPLIAAAARRLRPPTITEVPLGSSKWKPTAKNSASASRAPTAA